MPRRNDTPRASPGSAPAPPRIRLDGRRSSPPRRCAGPGDQFTVIRTAHIRKANAEAVVVLADERIVAHEVDVIFDDHQIALGKLRIHAAASVADNQRFAPQRLHDAHRQRDLFERIALVKVETAFHGHNALPGEPAAYQPARVRLNGRNGKVRNIAVIKRRLRFDFLGQTAEAGAENDADAADGRTIGRGPLGRLAESAQRVRPYLDLDPELTRGRGVWIRIADEEASSNHSGRPKENAAARWNLAAALCGPCGWD